MRVLILILPLLASCMATHPVALPSSNSGYAKQSVDKETVHLFSVNLDNHVVRPLKSKGLMTTQELANKNNAIAAINGGFFQADGTPAGLLVIDRKVLGYQSKPRAALAWQRTSQDVLVDRIIYTRANPHFVSGTGWTTPDQWEAADFVVGGTPVLIHEFQIVPDFSSEKVRELFLTQKHARSAVCVRSEQEWIFVVVEGSSSFDLALFSRRGFTMAELAAFMHDQLNCRFAINLDGGGSSTLVINDIVVNRTTHGQRPVSDAIGVFLKR